ncbi:MAG TPA: helix-turn-helix transcriptional regulator [Tepidisphaeraceae bacterium]|nr:helix-turn-helix transcriptional regulator [Tepidisphaeraceae bacterium]
MRRPRDVGVPFHCDAGSPIGRISWAGTITDSVGHPPRRWGNPSLVYVLAGACTYRDESGRVELLGPGHMILVVPGLVQGYQPEPGRSWTEQYINFDGPVFDAWFRGGLIPRDPPILRLTPVSYWSGRMTDVVGSARWPSPLESAAQVTRLQQLLADMLLHADDQDPKEDRAWRSRACAVLEAGLPDRARSLPAAARELGMKYETFRKRFVRVLGMSPRTYRQRKIFDLAGEMMARPRRLTNKELAARCGFYDEYHFSRQFKRVTGMTPTAYRRTMHSGAPPATE